MTRSRDVADSQDNLGGAVAPYVAGKNKIINGDFGIWQRGTTGSLSNGVPIYLADRFQCYTNLSGGSVNISQQAFAPGTAPVTGYESQYFMRWNQVSGASASSSLILQAIEDVRTFAGQTVTWSFWAKADAARTLTLAYEQYCGIGGSGYIQGTITTQTLTTSWNRYSFTFAVPGLSGKTLGANSYLQTRMFMPNNTTQTIDTWGWQLEAGSTATPFTTASGSIGGELALCQRYFEKSFSTDTAPANGANSSSLATSVGANYTYTSGATGNESQTIYMKVPKRATPTLTFYGNNSGQWLNPSGGVLSTMTDRAIGTNSFSLYQTYSGSYASFYGHWIASAEL